MALIELKRDPSQREVRHFAFGWLPAACFVLAVVAVMGYASWSAAAVLGAVGALSIVLGAVSPRTARGVYLVWMWAAYPLGWLVSHLVIATIYFLLITPMGLVMRLAGRDPLGRRFDREAETYWRPRTREADPSSYFRQF
ncbi:MAG: hypothetical protein DWQ37_15625 [Planctomycetota bacterium]|nr:MAG: hypothetical protein DWQ37_15625 [Planctomycetota bacterium]